VAVGPAGIRNAVSTLPSRSFVEKFRAPEAEPLLPHYATFLPPYEQVIPGSKEARFSDILTLSEAERPIMLVGVMRSNTPELVPLWGPARHLDDGTCSSGGVLPRCGAWKFAGLCIV
jgi:hypothetical protein